MDKLTLSNTTDILRDGSLYAQGLLRSVDIERAEECITTVSKSQIETIRVLFADQHGLLRGKTIVAEAFPSLFMSGMKVPNTLLLKDISHRTVFPVWSEDSVGFPAGAGDIVLVPEPSTYRVLPWSAHSAWIFCTPVNKDGSRIPYASRSVLQYAIDRLSSINRQLRVGLEVEFCIFAITDERLDHSNACMPASPVTTRNLLHGYQLLTEQLYDRVEPLMDDLRRNANALGLNVRSIEIEMGPSQFEFTFNATDPMSHADNMVMFRTMVKEVCARKGLHATFMSKPHLPNAAASGWHVHQSLFDKSENNLMMSKADGTLTEIASAWIAGLLEHAKASCLLTTPTVNGYKRYKPHQLAPDRILWAQDNRGAMVRGLMAPNDPTSRIENRVAEPAANPYYLFASQIFSGLDGINHGRTAPAPIETPYMSDVERLPANLQEAIKFFESSNLYSEALGTKFVTYLAQIKRAEWERYHSTVSQWEHYEYFSLL
ncbi:MAG: glutamine synthetase family protein [Aestuariivita sp.]|nr:glutamine synthetase family protein [Aestuariivita sp.]